MAAIRTSTRARLFDAAASLIGTQGLHATTVDQIVELAGVAKGTVYYHFRSKNELFQALLIEGLKRLATTVQDEAKTSATPAQALARIVQAELDNIIRYEAFARLMMSQLWRADSLWGEEALRILHEEILAPIRSVLETGQKTGEFRTDVDVHMAAPVIFGMVATAVLGLTRAEGQPSAAQAAPQLVEMALGTVRALQ
jgi:AcrR family transcriptional regulator